MTSVKPASSNAANAARSGGETCVAPAKKSIDHTSWSSGAMFQSPTKAILASGSERPPPAVSRSAASKASLYS